MKIGLSSAAFYSRAETEDQAIRLRNFNIDVCEVFLETHSEYNASFGRLVKENLGDLPCISCHPKGTQFEPDLFGMSRRQTEDSFRIFQGALEAGEALGAKWYIWHGPPALTGPLTPSKIHQLAERFPLLQQEAAKQDRAADEEGGEKACRNDVGGLFDLLLSEKTGGKAAGALAEHEADRLQQ